MEPLSTLVAHFTELLVPVAAGQGISDVISTVGGELSGGLGGAEFGGIAAYMMTSFVPIANFVGLLIIVIAGIRLIANQDENEMNNTKRIVVATVLGLVLLNLAVPIKNAYLSFAGSGSSILSAEIIGFINFVEQLLAVVAVLMIIVNGIRAVVNYTGDQALTHIRRVIYGVFFGFLLIVTKLLIAESMTTGNPQGFLTAIVRVMNVILGLGALVATLILIYAGFLMIANVGKDEQYTRAKSLAARVLIGLIVIIASFAIINMVLTA
ncbi:MAG: hypothetical protein PHI23_01190 [Candidatus Peribacteraceae bacterium]|nr:hypothetical protein [Candidatus Peribacteraceae bacterium]